MHLFLQGPIGIGKSTLLQKAIKLSGFSITGFTAQRLIENGKTIGYRAVMVNGTLPALEASCPDDMDGVFLLNGKRNVSVLERAIQQVERDMQSPEVKLVLLDEIGGIELTSDAFMGPLRRILSGAKPCIGVLKSAGNLAHTSSVLKLGAEYPALHKELEDLIRQKGELLTVTDKNRPAIRDCLNQYVESMLKN